MREIRARDSHNPERVGGGPIALSGRAAVVPFLRATGAVPTHTMLSKRMSDDRRVLGSQIIESPDVVAECVRLRDRP